MQTCAIVPGFRSVVVASLLFVAGNNIAPAQRSDVSSLGSAHGTRINRVFVNLTGDPKLTHRLWTLLDFELEDAHVLLASTETDADAIVNGEIHAQVTKHNLGLGVIRMRATGNRQVENFDSCASLSSDEGGSLFDRSASGTGEAVRKKYPNASTIRLDPASDMTQSKSFRDELVQSLQESDFKIVDTSSSDITLRVDLVPEKVPVEENVLTYDTVVIARDGSQLLSSRGTGVLSATLEGHPPDQCPERVADLDWLSGNNPLYAVARYVAKELRRQNSRISTSNQVIRK